MSIISLAAIYFVVWWVVLFAVLPWGMRSQSDDGDIVLGSAHSAPSHPRLLYKALVTSVVAAVLVLALWVVVDRLGYNLESLADYFFPTRPAL